MHSTATLLTSLTQSTLEGLNHSKPALRSLIAAIDISKAFDTVPRHVLISKILDTDIPPNYKKWLANFLSGRQAYVSYRGQQSKTRMFPNGVPQGAVLSPSLFNLFLSDLPTPQVPGVSVASYADDLTIVSQHHKVDTARVNLQAYITQLEGWLTSNRMKVSAPKSSLTLVTPHTYEYRDTPLVTLCGSTIPVHPTTKILGVTLDRGLTFRPHIGEVNGRAKSRLNVMKALSSSTFGHSKESLTALYKQFVRPVMSYASMAWSSDLAQTHMGTLQKTQNEALRIATGCVRSTPVAHLHAEASVLPIRDHVDMRGAQFFAAASDASHPCHHLHSPIATRRQLHRTPASHFRSLHSNVPPPRPQQSERGRIHEHFVSRFLAAAGPNTVLTVPPPSISPDEGSLPRESRVHLARLRCGHHPALHSYEQRLRPEADPACRWCDLGPETVRHLFEECQDLTVLRAAQGIAGPQDLWDRPAESLAYLRSAGLLH